MQCFAVATVEMLPSSAYAQVGEGGAGGCGERVLDGGGWQGTDACGIC